MRSYTTPAPLYGDSSSPLVRLPRGAQLLITVPKPGLGKRYPIRMVRFEGELIEVDAPRIVERWPGTPRLAISEHTICESKRAFVDLGDALQIAARRQNASALPLRVYACRTGMHLHLSHRVFTAWALADHFAGIPNAQLAGWLHTSLQAAGKDVGGLSSKSCIETFVVRSERGHVRVEVDPTGGVSVLGKGELLHEVRELVGISGRLAAASAWSSVQHRRWALASPAAALRALRVAAVALDALGEPSRQAVPANLWSCGKSRIEQVVATTVRLGWVVVDEGQQGWLYRLSLSAGAQRKLNISVSPGGGLYAKGDELMLASLEVALGAEISHQALVGNLEALEILAAEQGWRIVARHPAKTGGVWQIQIADGEGATAVIVLNNQISVTG